MTKLVRPAKVCLLLIFSLYLCGNVFSQVLRPVGEIAKASSQLVFWYDATSFIPGVSTNRNSFLQVTNTNAFEGVWVHVQLYRSFNNNPGAGFDGVVRCAEIDFVDFYTPNDTHEYNMENMILNRSDGGDPIPGQSAPNSKGFIIVTPIVSDTNNRAISFQHLTGTTGMIDQTLDTAYYLNAMGRDAVNFNTGAIIPDGTVLDGVNNGFVIIQPREISFNFFYGVADPPGPIFTIIPGVDLIGITFQDQYNDDDTLGYRAVAGETSWSPFIHDDRETRISCSLIQNTCFNNFGLGVHFSNPDIIPITQINGFIDSAEVCEGAILNVPDFNPFVSVMGWTKIIVQDYDPLENQFGVINITNAIITPPFLSFLELSNGYADWMFTK